MHGVEKMGEEEGNLREDIEADGDDDRWCIWRMTSRCDHNQMRAGA